MDTPSPSIDVGHWLGMGLAGPDTDRWGLPYETSIYMQHEQVDVSPPENDLAPTSQVLNQL